MRIESKERYSRYLQTPKEGVDPLKELCDKLRSKGGVDWRQAILADQRVEFLRGKDLAAYFRSQPEQMLKWVNRGECLHMYVHIDFGSSLNARTISCFNNFALTRLQSFM